MKTTTLRRIGLQILLAASVCGGSFRVAGCLSSLGSNFNPCGTILNCDPAEWDLMSMDPQRPNYDYNPTCVIPSLVNCDPTNPVIGGSGVTTTTTTTGTTDRTGNSGTAAQAVLGGFGT